jgi:hypothetical protein
MPYKLKIEEVEREIENALAAIATMRERGADKASMDPLLARLARLKDERLKLIERQLTFDRSK